MANLVVKLGTLDLSSYVRVNPDTRMEVANNDMIEPAFSDSPLFEGQILTSLHIKNKEMKIPLFLHPQSAPYTQDALNKLVQQINQALRPASDLGLTVYLQMQLAQAPSPTFFTVQFGRFEPDFNFRQTEKGWFAGVLHLWVLPYGHTATERTMGTFAMPPGQSGGQIQLAPGFKDFLLSISPANLTGYYRLNESAGGLVHDSTANVNNGTYLSGPQNTYGVQGAIGDGDLALRVSYNPSGGAGSGGFTVPSTVLGNTGQPFTLTKWIRPASPQLATQAALFSNRGGGGFLTTWNGQNIINHYMYWGTGAGATYAVGGWQPGNFSIGQWNHIAIRYTGSQVWLHVNGQASSAAYMSVPSYGAVGNQLFVANEGGNYMFNGDVDEAAFWNTDIGTAAVASLAAAGPLGIVGDVTPQFDIRLLCGTNTPIEGRLGIISALPFASYNPLITPAQFVKNWPSSIIVGASGAWGSQCLALDAVGTQTSPGGAPISPNSGQSFNVNLSPASVYAGENRILGLVRGRYQPFGLRAFDNFGVPLGPTVVASSLDGWQIVDYGVLRVAPWQRSVSVQIVSYSWIDPGASGMFSMQRAWPAWGKEHGPIFVLPNDSTILNLDWDTQTLSLDGFDQPTGALNGAQDQLGNSWYAWPAAQVSGGGEAYMSQGTYNWTGMGITGSAILPSLDFEVETTFALNSMPASVAGPPFIMLGAFPSVPDGSSLTQFGAAVYFSPAAQGRAYLTAGGGGGLASVGIPNIQPGQYHLRVISRNGWISAMLGAPSGSFPGAASGAVLLASAANYQGNMNAWASFGAMYPGFYLALQSAAGAPAASVTLHAFRARAMASTGHVPSDVMHLNQPAYQNTRTSGNNGYEVYDLQARQRGPVAAPNLAAPSLGGGIFAAILPWEQGAVNDTMSVDVRVRERFTYAR